MTQTATRWNPTLQAMADLADKLEAQGNIEGAADVRNDIRELTTPRPTAKHYCDGCGRIVTGRLRIARYTDDLQVDWVLCAKCEDHR